MRDAAGFDDFCEYCECGQMHCDGSCREECRACGSDRCDGDCCDDDDDTKANQNAPEAGRN